MFWGKEGGSLTHARAFAKATHTQRHSERPLLSPAAIEDFESDPQDRASAADTVQ